MQGKMRIIPIRTHRAVWLAACIAIVIQAPALGYLINKDVKQTFVLPQDNYEVVLEGDWTSVSTADEDVINPFENGQVQTSFDGTDTTVSFSGDAIAAGTDEHHFGFGRGITKDHSKIKREYWTRAPSDENDTPGCSTGYEFDPETNAVTVTFGNDTDDSITITDSFSLVFVTPQPLEDMNRQDMGTGDPTGIAPATVLTPGESVSFVIPDITPKTHVSVVAFVEVEYTSPGVDEYADGVGIWTQVDLEELGFAVPTVSEWGMVVMMLLVMGAGTLVLMRRRALHA